MGWKLRILERNKSHNFRKGRLVILSKVFYSRTMHRS